MDQWIEGWMDGEGSDWMMDVCANGKYQRGNHFLQNIDLPKKKTKLKIGWIEVFDISQMEGWCHLARRCICKLKTQR